MISLKKYLEQINSDHKTPPHAKADELLQLAIAAYRSALVEMGNCSRAACPALGDELQRSLGELSQRIERESDSGLNCQNIQAAESEVREHLREWGGGTARHFQTKASEIKEILLVMARTAEAVGERDQRCARQLNEVTSQLQRIASLDDLTQIRASLKKSAVALKTSVDNMAAEGQAAMEKAQKEISGYQTKLVEAEQLASRDSLTGLRSRLWVENLIEERIEAKRPMCLAIIDLDGFKQVNDKHGHLVGDELLKQFSGELKSASRTSDVIGRWGGDEFILLLDCEIGHARTQVDRLREWSCGDYTVHTKRGPLKLTVAASIGLAEHRLGETMKETLARADAEMYQQKIASSSKGDVAKR